jgi:hypothetical protein
MKPKLVLTGVALIEIVMALVLFPLVDHAHIQTTDFVNFYAAATIVRDGHGSNLYTQGAQQEALKAILGYRAAEYFLHPAFEAAAFVPLTYLRIEHAFVVWTLINIGLLGLLPLLLAGFVPLIARRPHLGLVAFAFPPVLAALTLGQDSILVMFVVAAAYLLLTRKRDFVAGLVLALAMIKFQYVLILALLLLVSRKFRLIAGFALGCVMLSAVWVSVTGPAGLLQYAHFLQSFQMRHGHKPPGSDPMAMGLSSFLEAMGLTSHFQLFGAIGSLCLLGLGIIYALRKSQVEATGLRFSLFLGIALAATPYDHFQDLAVLFPAIVLATDAAIGAQIHSGLRNLILLSCGLFFVWPAVLLMLGGHYFWNSRIYLVYPVILLFILTLALQVGSERNRVHS